MSAWVKWGEGAMEMWGHRVGGEGRVRLDANPRQPHPRNPARRVRRGPDGPNPARAMHEMRPRSRGAVEECERG